MAVWNTDVVVGSHEEDLNCRERSPFWEVFNTSHTNNLFYVRDIIHTQGQKVITCAADGKVILHSLPSSGGHFEEELAKHRGRAHRIAMTPELPDTVVSAREDGHIHVIDLRNHNEGSKICDSTAFCSKSGIDKEETRSIYSVNFRHAMPIPSCGWPIKLCSDL